MFPDSVSGVFFVGYILDRISKRMVVVYLIFEKMLRMFLLFLYIYLLLIFYYLVC